MTGTTTRTLTQVNVRFPTHERARLKQVASQSQRTLSQLVRWAIDDWLTAGPAAPSQPHAACAETPTVLGPHVNVKIPEQTKQALTDASVDGTVSTAIRAAVTWWLDAQQVTTQDAPVLTTQATTALPSEVVA